MKFRIAQPFNRSTAAEKFENCRIAENPSKAFKFEMQSLLNLYKNILSCLDEMRIPYEYGNQRRYTFLKPSAGELTLSYHSFRKVPKGTLPDRAWFIHTSPYVGHFTIDPCGFAAFSLPALISEEFELSKGVDEEIANEFYETTILDRIKNHISRCDQKSINLDVLNGDPYLFIAGQIKTDSVVSHKRAWGGNINKHYQEITNQAIDRGLRVLFKPHPGSKRKNIPNGAIQFEGSIHDAIKNAEAVSVINSGVGFEALMHHKPVMSVGKSDYKWLTYSTLDETLKSKPDKNAVNKFLFHMINNVYVNANDRNRVMEKIKLIVDGKLR